MALERQTFLVIWIFMCSLIHRNSSFVTHTLLSNRRNERHNKNSNSEYSRRPLLSYPSSDIPFEPSMLLKIEDNVNNIVLIDSLRLQTETLSQSNKILYDWFLKHFHKLYPSIYSHEISYNEILRFLQYSPPSYVTATITQKSSVNVSATLNIPVKPYTCILPLLDIKAVLLKDMVDLVYNISKENAKLIECMDQLTTNHTSNVFALMSLVSSIQSNSFQNIRLQSTLNTHVASLSLYAFNDYICKFLIEHSMEYFNALFPTTPSELGNNIEEEEDKALLQLFQAWGQSNDFTVYKTTTVIGETSSSTTDDYNDDHEKKKKLSRVLSPVTLFSTFLQEKGYWDLSKGIAAEIESSSIVLTTLYSYALIMARVTEKLRASLVDMLEHHAADARYYKDIVISLELASATGTFSFLAGNNQTTTNAPLSISSSTTESPTSTLIRRVSNSVHYPQLEVTVDNVLLNEDEKESFLQAYVVKLFNRTNYNNSTYNNDNDNDSAGATAGNPKRLLDGDLASNSGSSSSSSSSGRKSTLPFNVNIDSAGDTKSSAAGQRRPPTVTTLDPPRDRLPPPRNPKIKDIYVDDSESPRAPTPSDEIEVVESLEEIYAEFGRDCNIRVIGSKTEDDGLRYSMLHCQQRPVGNRRQRVAVNKWIRYEQVIKGLDGTAGMNNDKKKNKPAAAVETMSSSSSTIVTKTTLENSNDDDDYDDGMLIITPAYPTTLSRSIGTVSGKNESPSSSSSIQPASESNRNSSHHSYDDDDHQSWVCNNPFDTQM